MTRTGMATALIAFIVLTVALGASTAYLLGSPVVHNSTTTQTIGQTSIITSISTLISTSTQTSVLATTLTQVETTTSVSVSVSSSPAYTVGIAYKQGIGFYLVDGSGMTLYFRTADIHSNGTSTCVGQCVGVWPVFLTQTLLLPPGLNASSFTVVTRADGMKQIEYNNWPLYYYSGDSSPGDTNGQGIGGIWFAFTLPAPSQITSTTSSSTSPTSSTSGTPTTTTATSTTTTNATTTSSATSSTHTTTSPTSTCYYYC